MKRLRLAVLLGCCLAVAGLAFAYPSLCPDDICVDCGSECSSFGESYGCYRRSSYDVACVQCSPGACGISAGDSCCYAVGAGGF